MKKKFYLLLLCIFCFFLCSGCVTQEINNNLEAGSAYTVTDYTGQKINFAKKPERIASLSIGADEILTDLVPLERILCVTYLADDAGISNVVERVKAIPNRSRGNAPESILAMNPDLVIASDFSTPEALQILRDMGLKVYTYKTPSNYEEIQATIRELAKVVDEQKSGEMLIAQMDERLADIQAKLGNIKEEEKHSVLFMSSLGAYYSPDSSFRDTCAKAIVIDVTKYLNYKQACTISQELVVHLNPDSFVIGGWSHVEEDAPEKFKEDLLSNKSYLSTNAGKNKSVIIIPSAHLLTCSQFFVLGIEDLARAAYPEKFLD